MSVFLGQTQNPTPQPKAPQFGPAFLDFEESSVYHSVGPFIRAICTRCCFTTTNMIHVCSNFHLPLTTPQPNAPQLSPAFLDFEESSSASEAETALVMQVTPLMHPTALLQILALIFR